MFRKSQYFIKITKIAISYIKRMTQQSSIYRTKVAPSTKSTQQLLNQSEHKKKLNKLSTNDLLKLLYWHLKDSICKKNSMTQTISSQKYFGNNKVTIEDLLILIKDKIGENTSINGHHQTHKKTNSFNKSHQQIRYNFNQKLKQNQQKCQISQKQNQLSKFIQQLSNKLKQKQLEIIKLNQIIITIQNQSKNIQIKLLNTMKKINIQLQQKDKQLQKYKQIVESKNNQILFFNKNIDKKQKTIRKLQEDIYDLQQQIQTKTQELQSEKKCADFLQKKVCKLIQQQIKQTHQNSDQNEEDLIKANNLQHLQNYKQSKSQHLNGKQEIIQNNFNPLKNNVIAYHNQSKTLIKRLIQSKKKKDEQVKNGKINHIEHQQQNFFPSQEHPDKINLI